VVGCLVRGVWSGMGRKEGKPVEDLGLYPGSGSSVSNDATNMQLLCGDSFHSCFCDLPPGHGEANRHHQCRCGGAWTEEHEVVNLPLTITPTLLGLQQHMERER
jgi:hypothetical protein